MYFSALLAYHFYSVCYMFVVLYISSWMCFLFSETYFTKEIVIFRWYYFLYLKERVRK